MFTLNHLQVSYYLTQYKWYANSCISYCLANNGKKSTCSIWPHFFLKYFWYVLIESADVEPTEMEGQLHLFTKYLLNICYVLPTVLSS
jgi:hypothetical protein